MQQQRAATAVRRAQVELDGARRRLRPQPGRPLGRGQVAGEGHLRRLRRHLADRLADHQLVDDQRQPAEHGVGGVERLGQPRPGPAAQPGERGGQPRRRDEVVGGRREAAGPEHVGGVDEEPRHPLGTGMGEHVGVPAGAVDTGAVPRAPPEAAVRPRHPRDRDLHPRHPAQQGGVVPGREGVDVEGRDVPRTGDDGHGAPFRQRPAHLHPHVRLTSGLSIVGQRAGAHGGHRLADGTEHRLAVAAMLDEVLPPALGVGLAGGRGQPGQRVDGGRAAAGLARDRQRDGEWEVDGPHLDPVLGRPRHRLPLRAEHGERGEHRPLGLGDDVAEQGHRRLQPGPADPPQRLFGVGRRLHQHEVGGDGVQRPADRARRSRAVVADAEQVRTVRRGRDRRRRTHPSRPGRARRPRGTPATPRRRAADRARPPRRCRRPRRRGAACRHRSGRRGRGRW